jgi:hypothetical protein
MNITFGLWMYGMVVAVLVVVYIDRLLIDTKWISLTDNTGFGGDGCLLQVIAYSSIYFLQVAIN